jgi:hypothetical protein
MIFVSSFANFFATSFVIASMIFVSFFVIFFSISSAQLIFSSKTVIFLLSVAPLIKKHVTSLSLLVDVSVPYLHCLQITKTIYEQEAFA